MMRRFAVVSKVPDVRRKHELRPPFRVTDGSLRRIAQEVMISVRVRGIAHARKLAETVLAMTSSISLEEHLMRAASASPTMDRLSFVRLAAQAMRELLIVARSCFENAEPLSQKRPRRQGRGAGHRSIEMRDVRRYQAEDGQSYILVAIGGTLHAMDLEGALLDLDGSARLACCPATGQTDRRLLKVVSVA